MADSQVEDIKSKVNIVDVVGDYLQLKRAGVNYKARCPFHEEKTPSFYVTPSRQIWHCFGCGLGGDVIEFVKRVEGIEFPEALERLATRAGVELTRRAPGAAQGEHNRLYGLHEEVSAFYHEQLLRSPAAEQARQYVKSRKLTVTTVKQWHIGYAPDSWEAATDFLSKRGFTAKELVSSGISVRRENGRIYDRFRDRVMFPIIDHRGRTVGFTGRIIRPQEGAGKYINSPETPIYSKGRVIFGLYQARQDIRKQGKAVLVEGNLDVIKSHQAEVKNVVGTSGTALTENQLTLLRPLTEELIFAFDSDEAGSRAARSATDPAVAVGFTVRVVEPVVGFKDADEIIDRDPNIWKQAIESARDYLDFYFQRIFGTINNTDAIGKKRATAEFLSLLSRNPDKIVIGHYVHRIAERLGVRDLAVAEVLDQLKRQKGPVLQRGPGNQAARSRVFPSQETRVEQRFIGLMLRNSGQLPEYLAKHDVEHFTSEEYRQLFGALKEYHAGRPQPHLDTFFLEHGNLKGSAEQAIFSTEVDSTVTPEDISKELAEVSQRLLVLWLTRRQDQLSAAIGQAEAAGKDTKQLAAELNDILQKKQFVISEDNSYGKKDQEVG